MGRAGLEGQRKLKKKKYLEANLIFNGCAWKQKVHIVLIDKNRHLKTSSTAMSECVVLPPLV